MLSDKQQKIMSSLARGENWYARFIRWLSFIGTFWVMLIMMFIVVDVVGRYAFNSPLTGTPELVRASIVAMVFLQMAHVLRQNRHLRSTLLERRFSPAGVAACALLGSLLGVILFYFLCLTSWDLAWRGWLIREYEGEGALRVPIYPARFIIVLGSGLMCIQFILNLARSLKALIISRKEVKG